MNPNKPKIYRQFRHGELRAEFARVNARVADVADAVGVSATAIYTWLSNVDPGVPRLVEMLRAIGWTDARISRQTLGDWYDLM